MGPAYAGTEQGGTVWKARLVYTLSARDVLSHLPTGPMLRPPFFNTRGGAP